MVITKANVRITDWVRAREVKVGDVLAVPMRLPHEKLASYIGTVESTTTDERGVVFLVVAWRTGTRRTLRVTMRLGGNDTVTKI